MSTILSETMEKHLEAVPFGSYLSKSYSNETNSWTEICLHSDISSTEKLLTRHYNIFPGVDAAYNYFLADHFYHQHPHMPAVMEVNHCRKGRIGWQMEHHLNLYLGEGDLSVHMKDNCAKSHLTFPLGYYEGISFSIHFQDLIENLPDVLKDADLNYEKLQTVFCDPSKLTALSSNHEIDCIFHTLYDLPENLVIPYCRLKVQELILFLSQLSLHDTSFLHPYDNEQIRIVKEVHLFLTEHLNERYTIEELSKKYLMNSSTLKTTFKAVYGMPIATYMKQYRMNQAVHLLRSSNAAMAEIAAAVGYENQSKFTAAFKDVIGVLPTTFRKNVT